MKLLLKRSVLHFDMIRRLLSYNVMVINFYQSVIPVAQCLEQYTGISKVWVQFFPEDLYSW